MKGMEGHERKVGEGEEFEFKNYIPTRCLITKILYKFIWTLYSQ
jgi:hypothetical protein